MSRKLHLLAAGGMLTAAVWVSTQTSHVGAGTASSARSVGLVGTTTLATGSYTPSGDGDVTQAEFPGALDEPSGQVKFSRALIPLRK